MKHEILFIDIPTDIMMWERHFLFLTTLYFFSYVVCRPLDIVTGKTGEEQVREALDRAEKESEEAAKEHHEKSPTAKFKLETEEFLSSNDIEKSDKLTRSSTELKDTLNKKMEEISKFHQKLSDHNRLPNNVQSNNVMHVLGGKDVTSALNFGGSTDTDINKVVAAESDQKMIDMAKKLNNLVLKFQRKMGKLQHRAQTSNPSSALLQAKEAEGYSSEKAVRGKGSTPPIDLAALKNALGLLHTGKAGVSTGTKSSTSPTQNDAKLSYKEDTKLEDRLAMEAEEEKKFSNGDTYDEGEGEGGEEKSSSSSSNSQSSSLSPKEQASQEMQSYNALISTESNRELSQIQEEITKATQSSMGQVSVVGQKEQVNTEPPALPSLGGLGSEGNQGVDSQLSAALGAGMNDPLAKSIESMSGSSTEQFQGMGNAAGAQNEGLESAAAAGSEVSNQQTSSVGEQNGGLPGTSEANQQVNLGNQSPIEIGGSQTPVEMGTLGTASNPFSGGRNSGQVDPMQSLQNSLGASFGGGGGQQGMEMGQNGMEQQQSMSFKKSKIQRYENFPTNIKYEKKRSTKLSPYGKSSNQKRRNVLRRDPSR